MDIAFRAPCGKRIRTDAKNVGNSFVCPRCRLTHRVPGFEHGPEPLSRHQSCLALPAVGKDGPLPLLELGGRATTVHVWPA
jgi:hypothetical protein